MEISLKLNSQEKINALGELLLIAAKTPTVNEHGMKMALILLDDLKAAVAAANVQIVEAPPAVETEQKEAA